MTASRLAVLRRGLRESRSAVASDGDGSGGHRRRPARGGPGGDRRRILVVVALVAALVAVVTEELGGLVAIERASLKVRYDLRGDDPGRIGPVPIAVVGIDDRTLNAADGPGQFPFRRRWHARLLNRLRAAGVRTVAYDVEFTERTTDLDDNRLIEAVGRTPRIVLAASEIAEDGTTRTLGGVETQRAFGARVGHATVEVDDDGILRRTTYARSKLSSFAVATAERTTGRRVDRGRFDADGDALIDWVGGNRTVPTYSFVDVLRGRVGARELRGRIVVVGATSPVLKDVVSTPMDDALQMAGPEVQANAIATVLRGVPLREAPWPLGLLLTVLAAALPTVAARRRRAFGTVVAVVAGVVAVAVLGWVAFLADRVLPVAEPLFALGLGALGAVSAAAAFEAVEVRRTREIFSRFVSTDVVDDVLARTDDDVRLGGLRVDATVLFCDLRGSTALLQTLEPERGIAVLNRFLGAMSDCVDGHGGTLVGYRGDGLMAVFGAPLEQDDHADRAVACALEMAGPALDRCHAALRADGVDQRLRMGVGVASGEVMAGNVGSEKRMEYTAIGDPANVAARLEGLTKDHGRPILIAAGTVERLGSTDGLDPLGPVPVRGRAGTVEVWAAG